MQEGVCVPGHGVDTAGRGHGSKCGLRWLRGNGQGQHGKVLVLSGAYGGVCGWHRGHGGAHGQGGCGEGHVWVETRDSSMRPFQVWKTYLFSASSDFSGKTSF